MGVGCRWDPWSTVSRSDTLPQGLCQDSAWQFQCLGLWRGWVVKLCQDMLVGSVFGIILPEFAWIHSRWLVQHNDYVAADSWTQWSVIVSDGRIFWSRQRQLQRALTTIKTSFRRLPCQSSCHLQTLPLPVATVQLPKTQKPCLNAVLDAVLAFYHLKPQGRCGIFSGSTDVRLFQGLYPLTTLILDALVPVVVW